MKVVRAQSQKEIIDNFLVRGDVFIIGQNIDWELEFDGLDQECTLFVCYIGTKAVGAARLYQNKVGRVATVEEYRKQGVASHLMKYIEEYAREQHITELLLNAQLYIRDFYETLGYRACGEVFLEAGIKHIKMTKKL